MEKKPTEVKSLKPGSYIIIDDIPCRVDSIQISRPGKHGSAKAKVIASGLFTDQKKIIVKPANARMDIPIIEKKSAQIISIQGDNAQIMDLADYSVSEISIPEEFQGQFKEGDEVLVWKFGPYVMIKGKK